MQEQLSSHALSAALDVEQAVLGAVMRDQNALYDVIETLSPESFHDPKNRHIWNAVNDLSNEGKPVDIATVTDYLQDKGKLDLCGGRLYVIKVADSIYTAASVVNHAQILIKHQKRRQLQSMAFKILDGEQDDVDEMLQSAESELLQVSAIGDEPLNSLDVQIENMITYDQEVRAGKMIGYDWPIHELTMATRGIQPGRVYLIVGLFKSGKTKLLIAVLRKIIEVQSAPVLFMSMEMGATQVMHWLAGCALGIDTSLYGSPRLGDKQQEKTHRWVTQQLADGRLRIDDRAVQTPESICTAIRRAAIRDGTQLVAIDYLQRIDWGRRPVSAFDIAQGMRIIAAAARRHGVGVIALSQVPKGVEKEISKDRLITLSDVKDSGGFAESCDAAISITDLNRHMDHMTPERNLTLLVQQRDGPTKRINVSADLRFGHFK